MLKKSIAVLALAVTLVACGPAPQPPADPTPPAPAVTPEQPAPPPIVQPEPPRVVQAPRPARKPHYEPRNEVPPPPPVRQVCTTCGTIAAVQEVRVKGEATAYGTLGGAAAGGVAGAQFGKKSGKILATIGGAVLGGLAGREVEKQVRATHVYDVTLDMEEGGHRTLRVETLNGLGVGSRVRIEGDALVAN